MQDQADAFADHLVDLFAEFNEGHSIEAKLAHDADQLALILELKDLMDMGYKPPESWIQNVISRLETETGRKIARAVMDARRDEWWLDTGA